MLQRKDPLPTCYRTSKFSNYIDILLLQLQVVVPFVVTHYAGVYTSLHVALNPIPNDYFWQRSTK